MRSIRAFLFRIAGLFRKVRAERELADEIQSHLELHIRDNLRAGMTPEDARRNALIAFGGMESAKEAYRDRRGLPLVESFVQDVRYGLRALRKSPGFTAVAIATLALGIGADTAMYSVVRAVMLRPLPASHPERLVRVAEANQSRGFATYSVSIPNYTSWKKQARTLEFAAVLRVARTSTGAGEPVRLEGVMATASYLSVLGTSVSQGRWFQESEERPGEHRVVVLSDGFWKRQFGGDPGVIGRNLTLDGEPYAIVGIARPDLAIPIAPDVWVPLLARPYPGDSNANRGNRFLQVIARLKPGFTATQASAEMASITGELERQYPASNQGWSAAIVPLLQSMVPLEIRTALAVLLAAVSLVLLIACANIANLLLARSAGRRKEVAIRVALGAGAMRIARQLITETMLLSLAGGVAGVALGDVIARIARSALAEIVPRAEEIAIDGHVLGLALAVSLVTGLLFGAAPLLQFRGSWSLDSLRQAGRSSQAAPRSRLRALLVIGQVSLATLMLVGAGLLIQSMSRLQQVPVGMDPDPVLTARLPLPGGRYFPGGAYAQLLASLAEALRGSPGVQSAGISTAIPLGPGAHTGGTIAVPGSAAAPLNCAWRSADAGFFATLGIPILRGRVFDPADVPGRRVFVLSQAAARAMFGTEDPVGRPLRLNDAVGEVIGVVGDLRMRNLADPPDRIVYQPLAQGGFFGVFTLFVRTHDRPESATALVKAKLHELDPSLPVYDFRLLRHWVDNNSSGARIRTWVLAVLAGIALVLGMIGIYGVLAYLVMLRRHEFGVRLALGARPASLLRMVLAQGLGLAAVGVAVGLGAAFLLTSALDKLLFGVTARDPATFAAVAALLLSAATIACYVPARRAAAADPIVTLRSE